uniref:DRBM domain-containing protein n=1 Tax=Salix viminalis TaxID=40686 RepID=A0A6N2NBX5_SALVM
MVRYKGVKASYASMTSIAMDVADACPAEDFIAVLIQYLVDPKLQRKSSDKGATSQIEQESIAKQLYAVVLLYNHRKQHPQLEFLCFENFCKIAVVVKPALLAHIRLLQRSNDTKSQTFPLLEERIMEACSISMSLDASEDDLNIEGWPISRVAVLLIDSKKENCFLQFGSITEGVWSVIEKDVDVSNDSSEEAMELAFSNLHFWLSRKRQGPLAIQNSSWWMHTSVVEYFHLLTYAEFLSDWLLREGLSNGLQVQRVGLETINVSSSDMTERPCEAEISERFHNHNSNDSENLISEINSSKQNGNDRCCMVDLTGDYDRPQEMNVDESSVSRIQNKYKRRNVSSEDQPQNYQKTNTVDRCLKDLASKKMETVEKGSTSGDNIKADIADRIISQKGAGCRGAVVANGKKNCNNMVANEDRMPLTDHAVVTCQSNSKDLDKLWTISASKDKELSRAAMTVVLSKRDKLSLQQRDIEDQIAQGDKNIETILKGGEDNLSLKIESLIEGFNHRSLRSVSQERTYEDQCLPPTVKGKRLPDIMLDLKNSCQAIMKNSVAGMQINARAIEQHFDKHITDASCNPDDLDGVCYENNWILPSYHVSSQDGGFLAAVTVKGTGFECSSEGELCPCPREARESAAKRVFAKLGNMPNMSW